MARVLVARLLAGALLLALAGCDDPEPADSKDDTAVVADEDGDGYTSDDGDCDDGDAAIHPAATEVCNGVDDDCDDELDEGVLREWFADADGDGWGDVNDAVSTCEAPVDYVANAEDCDDGDAAINPDAAEICDELDNDCDGEVDPGLLATWYADLDADGYGDPASTTEACDAPQGWVADATDCDDALADVHPGAAELCDGVDQDCDGETDEGEAEDAPAWHADADGDGFGDPRATARACTVPAGYVADAGDCDDADAAENPSATEVCDGDDDDCDGVEDEADAAGAPTWYVDVDGDGYGTLAGTAVACDVPSGYAATADDCDDGDRDDNPGASERCDGEDDDCDGTTDEADAVDAASWYEDDDGDGYGDATASTRACDAPANTVANDDDCDDADAAVSPAGTELCNSVDDDCDGTTDEASATDAPTWYRDSDADGYGTSTATRVQCTEPSGYVGKDDDCDDTRATVSPADSEACSTAYDDDCDGTANEDGATGSVTYYADADADSYGDAASSRAACTRPATYVTNDDDCDDTSASVSPADSEVCNDVDDDCDGSVDEAGSTGTTRWYLDADGDGYGVSTSYTNACDAPSGYVASSGDCADTDDTRNPAASESCDGVDNDCDGTTDEASAVDASTWYRDSDADGYGVSTTTSVACSQPSGYADNDDDCNDASASISPGDAEVCYDSTDQDCDGTADDGCPTWTRHCGSITSSETWAAGDHYVYCDVTVGGGASPTLTIADGATVYFASGAGLLVGQSTNGKVLADGTTYGITFTSEDTYGGGTPAAGDWDGIYVGTYDRGSTFTNVTIEYGGAYGYGNLYVTGNSSSTVTVTDSVLAESSNSGLYAANGNVDVTGSTFADNADWGVYLDTNSDLLAAFTDNTLTGNALGPMALPAAYVDLLDTTSSFSGNTVDQVYVFAGTISTTASWPGIDADYRIPGDLYVQGAAAPTLTLEDGASLLFDAYAGITVGSSSAGKLVVAGSTLGVTLSSSDTAAPLPGDWDGVYLGYYDRGTSITGATIEYAGGNGYGSLYLYYTAYTSSSNVVTVADSVISDSANSGIYAIYYSALDISGCDVTDNADYGVYLDSTSSLWSTGGPTFTDNALTGNDLYPISLPAGSVGQLDATSTFSGNGTDYVYVQGATVSTTQTWQALDADYKIAGDVTVAGGGTPVLTIEDGAVLKFDSSAGLTVGGSNWGVLDVQGTTLGVTFTSSRASPAAGDWDGVTLSYYDRGSTIDGATIQYGGGNGYGNVYVYYTNYYDTTAVVSITDSTLRYSGRSGLYVNSYASVEVTGSSLSDNTDYGLYAATDTGDLYHSGTGGSFANNEVTGNDLSAAYVHPDNVGELDASSTFGGNTYDRVQVPYGTLSTTQTWQDLDVEYYVSGDVYVGNSASSATLTIEAGTRLEFASTASLLVGSSTYGKITAVGTSASPIVFTSAASSPAAGDWDGIQVGYYDRGSTFDYTSISYGGANGVGNLYFYYCNAATTVSNSSISYSSRYGIYRYGCSPSITGVTYTSNSSGNLY
ncbi:MAG: MopE-related protein [Myxococcota bacterium]